MICRNCNSENEVSATFCIECGQRLHGIGIDQHDKNKKYFVQTLLLLLIIILIIISSQVSHLPVPGHDYLFSGLLILTTFIFAILSFKSFIQIFKFSFRFTPVISIILGAPLLALLVVLLAKFLNPLIGYEPLSYHEIYQRFTPNMYIWGLLFVSVVPGFIEEFLFRGILFNHLLKLTSARSAILITAILFAFLHFAFFSLLWLSLIGLYLGYLRHRYQTIWYCIFFHTLYNGSVFFIEMYI